MKKNHCGLISGVRKIWKSKFLKSMRIVALLILISITQTFALDAYAQSKRLSLDLKNETIINILEKIEDQSEFYFMFDASRINVNQRKSVDCENQLIKDILDQLFEDTGITYSINDRQVLLTTIDKSDTKQQRTVSGKVTDSSGSPLPGVTVLVKGTTNGTVTNVNGEYSLANIQEGATLQFSFIGMKMQEVEVKDIGEINVTMVEESIGLEEVVAIGYGTMKKQAVTGAVAKADLQTYQDVPVNNVLEQIKGSMPGLNIGGINTAGEVGNITIRGTNTIAAGNSPLIVVDGAIFNGSLAELPSADIANFTVLKDASAAAVYGSRSANGVILVETKKGAGIQGKPMFNIKTSYGVSSQLKALEVYDADGYLQRILDIREANNAEANPEDIRNYLQDIERDNYEATSDHTPTLTNPYDLISQMGHIFNTSISISNSTEKSSYYISTSLVDQKGVVLNDNFKHISGRINIESDLTDWFNLGIKSYYSLRDYSGSSPSKFVTYFSPYASVYNDDGSYRRYPQTLTSFYSPFWEIATEDTDLRNNLTGTVVGKIKIPWVEGLSYNVTYSNSLRWNERFLFYDKNTTEGSSKSGKGSRDYDRYYNSMIDNMIKYSRTFSKKHFVDATLLLSQEHNIWESMNSYAEGFDNLILGSYALENGNIQTVNTGGGESNAIGMMARGSYTYNFKYSLTGTIRRDGYSGFSRNKKWGVFPSVGFNWNISRENFMKDIKPVNSLALRISYGKNGNQSIEPYSTLARVATSKYIYGGMNSYAITQYISSLANYDLGWESTTGLNIGVDFSLIENRISGAIDVYKSKTNDLLFDLSIPAVSGFGEITSNIGEIQNKGVELNLHTLNVESGEFQWTSDFAFSLNRNKIATILGQDNDGDGIEDDLVSSGYFIGKSLGTIYSYKVTGMWQQEDEDNGTIMNGMKPGYFKLEDVDGDGAISSDKDRQFIGTTEPNFRWSWTNTLKYKNLSMMLYFYSIWGGNGHYLSTTNTPYNDGYINFEAMNHPVYDYWTPTNTDAMFPRADYYSKTPYRGIKYIDRSFIKLQKVSLTYNMSDLVKPFGIHGLSCSLSADNLFTYAPHWVGLDPETNNGVTDRAIPSIRTYLFSVSLNF